MKSIKNFRIGVIFSLLFFLSQNLLASFIINDDNLIDPRAIEKINEIGKETKEKLGVNIFIYSKRSLGLDENIKTKERLEYIKNYENDMQKSLNASYILLTMSVEDKHVNLLSSKDLDGLVDKDDILDGYVVPLLASKDKNTLLSKVSASMLNGYSAIVDRLVENHNKKNPKKEINILSNDEIGTEGKTMGTIMKVVMYFLIISGLLAYTYAVLRKK
jgi:hypothetical protein